MVLGKYMQELKVWAQGEIEAATSQKARFLTGGSEYYLCENSRAVRADDSRSGTVLALVSSTAIISIFTWRLSLPLFSRF